MMIKIINSLKDYKKIKNFKIFLINFKIIQKNNQINKSAKLIRQILMHQSYSNRNQII